MVSSKYILASILYHFDVTVVVREDEIKPLMELSLKPESGVPIKLLYRRH